MAEKLGSGKLFKEDAHSVFIRITGSRYDNMDDRMERKGLPPLPFSKAQFRSHILAALGGTEDGFVKCRYCLSYFGLQDIATDHAMPLSRGGTQDLGNMEYICRPCNNRKGSMTPDEYLKLLSFLETLPFARIDVLKRLELSVQLAAGQEATRGVVRDLKQSGAWKEAQVARRQARKGK